MSVCFRKQCYSFNQDDEEEISGKTKRISNGENEILLTNYKPKYEEHKYSVKSTLSK